MPKLMTITASTKVDGRKVEATPRDVEFNTRSEARELLARGEVPAPWTSFEEFFLNAVAHKVVLIQNEMREELTSGTSGNAKRNALLD